MFNTAVRLDLNELVQQRGCQVEERLNIVTCCRVFESTGCNKFKLPMTNQSPPFERKDEFFCVRSLSLLSVKKFFQLFRRYDLLASSTVSGLCHCPSQNGGKRRVDSEQNLGLI